MTESLRPRWMDRVSAFFPLDADIPPDAEVDVFAFPHAGASAAVLIPLKRCLPPWLALRPIELPGRGRRMTEDPRWRLDTLVAVMARELAARAGRPALFFGHSMGALLAYETARQLPTAPAHLVVSGHRGPQQDRGYLQGHEEDDATFATELRRWGGEEADWLEDEDLRSLFLPVLREDFRALVAYRHREGPPLPCPITALRGAADPYLDDEGLAAWATLTEAQFSSSTVPGGHFFWLRHPDRLATPLVEIATSLRPAP